MNNWMWRASAWQSFVLGASTAILCISMKAQLPTVSLVFLVVAIFNFLSLLTLWLRKNRENETLASIIYFLNFLFSGIAIGINQNYWLASDKPVELFFGHKIMALMIAIQAPPKKLVGFACLTIILFIPIGLLMSWSAEQRSHLSAQEPMFTLTLILSCFFVYTQRLKTLELLHEKVLLETSVREWKKFRKFLLGVQHLVNSQLQIIETASEIAEKKFPETSPLPQKIRDAAIRLRKISQVLSKSQENYDWREFQMSVSIEELEKEMDKISSLDDKIL